ncbi:MAG TPA: efflux RND transporter periplasmic adaptor subunit, partial [Gammaproteobacteria bacterium]|nr:efflux RND transporter periplasmic adaptor subunit [Gammaproteobacteria bacterium]
DAVERDMALLALMKEKYAIQQREVQRMEKLGQESLASKSNYDSALRALLQLQEEQTRLQFSVNTAQSRLATRRSELNLAERNLERSRLNAPFAATVNAVAVDIGDYIAAGQVALELVQIDTLDLYLEITGELARVLELGQEIPVVVSGTTYVGRIHALAPDPAPLTHTHALRIRVTGTSLFPGQLAEAALPGEISRDVTVVPVSAVLREEGEAYVFSVTGETLQRLPVNPLARQDDMQVIDGVPAGTKIVIKDVGLLADGQKVHVQ